MIVDKVTVFCASSDRCDKSYLREAEKLGEMLAGLGKEIIYGGGKVGLMGAVAHGANSLGGRVTGIIPDFLHELDLGKEDITKLHVVDSIHKREAFMMGETDCIIVLPGSVGTMSELFQSLAWKFLGLINIPIIIINFNHYFDHLIEMLNLTVKESFMQSADLALFRVVDDAESAIALISNEIQREPLSTFLA
jgi:uncharacterized protein (TIGR00730 family)